MDANKKWINLPAIETSVDSVDAILVPGGMVLRTVIYNRIEGDLVPTDTSMVFIPCDNSDALRIWIKDRQ